MKYGIDVSMFVDVDILKYSPDFVMIRGGEGCEYKDRKALHYAQVCEDNGIPYGIYWVIDLSSGSSKEHAHECLTRIMELPGYPKMGVWADCETPFALDNVAVNEFCQLIQDAGYYAGIYTGINQLRNGTITCNAFDKWAAYYGNDSGSLHDFTDDEKVIMMNYCSIWQYHSGTGTHPDLDVCFNDDLKIYDLQDNDLPQTPGAGSGNGTDPDNIPAMIDHIIEELKDLRNKLTKEE